MNAEEHLTALNDLSKRFPALAYAALCEEQDFEKIYASAVACLLKHRAAQCKAYFCFDCEDLSWECENKDGREFIYCSKYFHLH